MEHCTILARVDVFASEHGVTSALDAGFAHKGIELGEDRIVDEVLGIIEQECGRRIVCGRVLARELGESLRVLGEQFLEDDLVLLLVIKLLELLPALVLYTSG